MTEKEKMQRQPIYDANYDQELIAERRQAQVVGQDLTINGERLTVNV